MSTMTFTLWRQDDNGQRFRIENFSCRAAAEQRQQELQRGGHRQFYWIESSQPPPPQVANLLRNIPAELPDELVEPLLNNQRFRLERIVSRQHASTAEFWYDQPADEWVLLVSGSAELQFTEPERRIKLMPGDHLLIPAHLRHRVVSTDPQQDTVWLALHFETAEQT